MPILRSGVSGKNAIDQRIDDIIHQRNEEQDQNRIRRLHLRGEQVHAEPMQIHVLRLQRPLAAAALIPERPENSDEKINDREPAKGAEAFPAESLLQKSETSAAGYGRISCGRAQKKIVAITIAIPGNAESPARTEASDSRSSNGQRMVEMNEPALIEK